MTRDKRKSMGRGKKKMKRRYICKERKKRRKKARTRGLWYSNNPK
jgi:hypothetical protein